MNSRIRLGVVVASAALVWLAHADNIDRLVHGRERKFDLGMLGRDNPTSGQA